VEETFGADWAKRVRELLVRAKRDREKDPDLRASYYSRVFKMYIGHIRPIIKAYDKKFKKTDEERLAFALEKHKYRAAFAPRPMRSTLRRSGGISPQSRKTKKKYLTISKGHFLKILICQCLMGELLLL
jgi:hypothetical protein